MTATHRKRPVEIEARQVTRENASDIAAWCGGRVIQTAKPGDPDDIYVALEIPTLEGIMRAETTHPSTWDGARYTGGDWIIRGVQGEFYPIKEAIFRETYEPVEES